MIRILFTKHYPLEALRNQLGEDFRVDSQDFIQTEFIGLETIKSQIDKNINKVILSSERTAKHIASLSLSADFYCVGETATKILEKANKKVMLTFKDGNSLVKAIKLKTDNCSLSTEHFLYFCSNIRRDEIPNGLRDLGCHVKEIICYHTIPKEVTIENDFDVYVFFSPSGVKSFANQYKIPKKASIFAIGKTTADSVSNELKQEAIIPGEPNLASLIQKIKTHFNAKE